ncbi:hypothetical protein ACFQPG_01155 [Sphingomonas sp. GCM10030256]|uniref:hypothetical protein n=1 Tax=Sphingomonas sp. GCM10030256 TaxID=3273427 RepID=UPI0036131767
MNKIIISRMALAAAGLSLGACQSSGMKDAVSSAGDTVASAAKGVTGAAVSPVNVDLRNVLNDLSLDLKLDKANIPVNAQIPITIAANICGVNINILSVSTGGQANCTANTTSPPVRRAAVRTRPLERTPVPERAERERPAAAARPGEPAPAAAFLRWSTSICRMFSTT